MCDLDNKLKKAIRDASWSLLCGWLFDPRGIPPEPSTTLGDIHQAIDLIQQRVDHLKVKYAHPGDHR